ncbi:hypothetical protein ACIBQ5_29830 [Streptomyces massasporeus]|uniref:hypothetical protein n=1 Tax=Streptomyces massasporeus TaxID=67324 RepID=UPI0037A990C2
MSRMLVSNSPEKGSTRIASEAGRQAGDDLHALLPPHAYAPRWSRQDDPLPGRKQHALVVGGVAVPTQQELPGVAVPVAVEDVVEILLGDGGVPALFLFLFGAPLLLLFLPVEGSLDGFFRSGQKAQQYEERYERCAEHHADHAQWRQPGRAETGVACGLEYVGRGLRDLADPAPVSRFGLDAEAVHRRPLGVRGCHVKTLLADAEQDRYVESVARMGRHEE